MLRGEGDVRLEAIPDERCGVHLGNFPRIHSQQHAMIDFAQSEISHCVTYPFCPGH